LAGCVPRGFGHGFEVGGFGGRRGFPRGEVRGLHRCEPLGAALGVGRCSGGVGANFRALGFSRGGGL
jgi:hypothetical protein